MGALDGNVDKTSDAARNADANRQLEAGRFRLFKGDGSSSRAAGRPENEGLDARAQDAIERENNGWIGGRIHAITGRARRAAAGGNHRR